MLPDDYQSMRLEAEKIGGCYECGVCTANCPLAHMIPRHYNPRATLLRLFLDPAKGGIRRELWLCMRCRRCSKRCPQGLKPHELFLRMRQAMLKSNSIPNPLETMSDVLKLLQSETPLPAVLGWLCLRPADKNSAYDRAGTLAAKALKDFLNGYRHSFRVAKRARSEKISIIGSGPAGLSAASELARRGYSVNIYEKAPKPGGMLRTGIPHFRLSRKIVNAEVDHIRSLGVTISTDTIVGSDITVRQLLEEGSRALFIASGCGRSMQIGVEGEMLEGVHNAIDFLERFNSGANLKYGDSVVVIGGGGVGIDAARAIRRLGPQTVRVLCPESRAEMPGDVAEITDAENEGIQIIPSCMPRRMLGSDGRVTGIELVKTRSDVPLLGGGYPLIPIEGSEFTTDADTVIVAIGQKADLSFLPDGIMVSDRNTIDADPLTLQTSMKGIFAGGDAILGPSSILEAVYTGWRAAASIDRYIKYGSA